MAAVEPSLPPATNAAGCARQRSPPSPPRKLSASLTGPAGLGSGSIRARPTTQEIIAEAFGRRLHGLDLLSVKKLNALSASAARLEAHMASRAAAITRTAGAGAAVPAPDATAGAGRAISPAASRELPTSSSFLASTVPPADPSTLLLSPVQSALPQGPGMNGRAQTAPSGGGVGPLGWSPQQHVRPSTPQTGSPTWQAGRYDGMSSIADRGSSVVRLLALQDRVLAGAIRAQAAASLPNANGGGGGAAAPSGGGAAGGEGGPRSSRFALLPFSAGEGGAGGGLDISAEEAKRLGELGIRHSSKVAATTVQLFRLTPRKMSLSGEEPATPPPTQRGEGDDDDEEAQEERKKEPPEPSAALLGLQNAVRRQVAKNRDIQAMSHFIQSLQEADELSLITRARNFNRQHSNKLTHHLDRTISTLTGAAGGTGSGSAPRSPQSPPRSAGGAAAALSTHVSMRAVSAGGALDSRESMRSPRGRLPIPEESELDLSRHSTGQPRSRDLLDGLMSAVSGGLGVGAAGAVGDVQRRSATLTKNASFGYGLGAVGPTGFQELFGLGLGLDEDAEMAGSPEPAFTGVYGSPERLARKVHRRGELAALTNPAGFREEAAAAEVALYRAAADQGRTALARAAERPRDALAAADLHRKVAMLHFCRPYFVAPGEAPPEVEVPLRPPTVQRNLARQNTRMVTSASHESCFLPRASESDGEDLVDSNTVRERQVRRDWNRVVRKDGFRSLFAHDDPGVAAGSSGLGHALDACLAVLLRHKDSMRSAFIYYGMTNPSVSDICFTLGLSEWRAFAMDAGLATLTTESGGSASGGGATTTASLTTPGNAAPGGPGGGASGGGRGRVPSIALARGRAGGAGAAASAGGAAGATPALRAKKSVATTPAVGSVSAGGAPAGATSSLRPRMSMAGGAATGSSSGGAGAAGAAASGLRPSPRIGERMSLGNGTAPGAATAAAAPAASPYAQVDAAFAAVNSEADKRSVERPPGSERTLLRFEWYEALIRLAVARHVKAGEKCGSIAAAVEHMWVHEALPALPPAARHEPNAWRVSRLFADPRVNDLLCEHMDVITALYDLFRAANPNKLLHLADWVGLLSTCGILGESTGLTPRAAKLAFARSLCVVVDELGRWGRAVCADKCDLMEALARLAEEMAAPPPEEVAAAFREVLGLGGRGLHAAMAHPWLFYYSLLPESHLQSRRRAAAEAAAAAAASQAAAEAARVAADPAATARSIRSGANAATDLDAVARRTAAAAVAAAGRLAPNSSPFAHSLSAATAAASPPLSPHWAPPPAPLPELSFQLEALLDLLLGRLREHWECDTNEELTLRLQVTARSLTAGM